MAIFSFFYLMNQIVRIQRREKALLEQYQHKMKNDELRKEEFLSNLCTQELSQRILLSELDSIFQTFDSVEYPYEHINTFGGF